MEDSINLTPPPKAADLIKDGNTKTFMQDVIQASEDVPIIVDFWAPWCGPCKQLGPALEKAVQSAKGAVKLVKINIDESPEIAQQLRIQSIPAVFAFQNGQPVDGFVGALPESEIKAFIAKLGGPSGPSPIEQALEQAKATFDSGDLGAAANIYGQIVKQEPGNPSALGGLARCYLGRGDLDLARQTLAMVPPEHQSHADVTAATAAVTLAEGADETGDLTELQTQVDESPNDHQIRFELAKGLISRGDQETGMNELLEIVRREQNWNDKAARKQLLTLFEALGATHELTVAGRRRLSSMLFS